MASDKLGDIRLFVTAAQLGSLSAAGRKLNLSPAAASARLFKLEEGLQAKLFNRTTRQLRLTPEGQIYLQHCQLALQTIDDGEALLQAGQTGVKGKIRLSASADFGRNLLRQWLEEFSASYPDLQIALTLSDSLSHLVQDDIDIAIRFAVPTDSNLIARKLAVNWRVLCASPEYLARYGDPKTPQDLINHRFIVLITANGPLNEFYFTKDGHPLSHKVDMAQAWETNDGALVRDWALAGHGIARKTIWDANADIQAGKLKVLLPEYQLNEAGVYALFHASKYQVQRVRVLLDFLIERFEQASQSMLDNQANSGF